MIVYLAGSQWVWYSGFFSWFGETPSTVGITLSDLLIQGINDFVVTVLVFAGYVGIEYVLAQVTTAWWAVAVVGYTAALLAVGRGFGPDPWTSVAWGWRLLEFGNALLFLSALAVVARVLVRETRWRGVAVAWTVLVLVVVSVGVFHLARAAAADVGVDPDVRGFESTVGVGFPAMFSNAVTVVGPEQAPSGCGLLLGGAEGSWVVWYPGSASGEDYSPGSDAVWRFPAAGSTLQPCSD